MARTVPVAPKPRLFDEYEMPTSAAHKARICSLQMLVKEQPVERYTSVLQKRRFRAAFDDVAWEQNLRKVYEDADYHQLKHFDIDPMPLNEPSFELLLSTVDDIIETSSMENVATASDEDKTTLIDAVMRAVCRECTSQTKIERHVLFKGKALESFGRVDLLRDGNLENAIVVECDEQNFDKGIARMVITAETALLERLEKDPQMDEHIYGIVSDLLTWQVMEVGAEGARFCKLKVDESEKEDGLRCVVGALAALLQGKEARDA
ncbi:hypothetical protein F441_06966 [Phytophthora nicotianae CJ01A1]|uniref:Uncharacterized protein n=4 Tax=Phytophthora nicotianae TaxID=4792 RepID=V9FCC3_PHYNI|nr:hypothetical protein F443_06958 [Phytophthora nicotianae P1569]ETK88993.1 hypothetical protein L915_06834 [Phytophthora nicotianae]ETP18872.1 hypothetical protein F441_06966 [Phytophthora nicotianae CJ01A1]ETL42400.1 hypothetical protein L916_06776 [Phytophthora nicotianae]ETL95568.1 hypothetical protein L917_06647 [Phytophthora nicotianae]